MTEGSSIVVGSLTGFIVLCLIIAVGMAGCPVYRVWEQQKRGEAELRRAEFAKKILVEAAKAELDSATLLAEAEVERAKGIAQSMEIVSEKLNQNYLQYWAVQAQIKMAESPNHTTIYIPSGPNGIPLMRPVD